MNSTEDSDTNITHLLLQISGPGFSASNATILIVAILIMLLMTAIISGSETAFFSLTAKDVDFLKGNEKPNARQAVLLLEQPKLLLATILVANNFINIAIVISTNMLVNSILSPGMNAMLAFFIQIVCVTFLLVLFGEVLPKVYATQNNLRMALFSSPFIRVLLVLLRPVSNMLVSSTKFIEGRMNSKQASHLSSEDFEHAIELTVGHTATREEVNIFKGILKFGNISAKQVMRTRLDVSAIDFEMSFSEVKDYYADAGYSRLPVYKDTLDKVSGMIYTKDFLPYIQLDEFEWHKLIRPAYFVHESKLIEDLLKEFQQKRIHFAIVVDEFGGTSGIITLEDIMEEIIGDIKDEFDDEDVNYKKIDDNNYIFEGKTLINDLCRIIGEPPETFESIRGESDSIGGLILEISGRFPVVNESIRYERFEFIVLALDKMRIQRVKLVLSAPSDDDDDE